MSLPITAVGPLKVETKPILMLLFWAAAEPPIASARAPASNNVLRIVHPPKAVLAVMISRNSSGKTGKTSIVVSVAGGKAWCYGILCRDHAGLTEAAGLRTVA